MGFRDRFRQQQERPPAELEVRAPQHEVALPPDVQPPLGPVSQLPKPKGVGNVHWLEEVDNTRGKVGEAYEDVASAAKLWTGTVAARNVVQQHGAAMEASRGATATALM